MTECPFKSICETPGDGCSLKELEEYCFPIFHLARNRVCASCGRPNVNCYSANGFHSGECLKCYCDFIFHRQAMMSGAPSELINKIIGRVKEKYKRVEHPALDAQRKWVANFSASR